MNVIEKKITRKVLEPLAEIDRELTISTKSRLILRNIDLLKQCKNLKAFVSINTLDEKFTLRKCCKYVFEVGDYARRTSFQPKYKPEVIEVMEEAKQISRDPNTKRYGSFAEALEDID